MFSRSCSVEWCIWWPGHSIIHCYCAAQIVPKLPASLQSKPSFCEVWVLYRCFFLCCSYTVWCGRLHTLALQTRADHIPSFIYQLLFFTRHFVWRASPFLSSNCHFLVWGWLFHYLSVPYCICKRVGPLYFIILTLYMVTAMFMLLLECSMKYARIGRRNPNGE